MLIDTDTTVTVEALYVVNKAAKKFTQDASDVIHSGQQRMAEYRRDALYEVKYRVLRELIDHVDRIELHIINQSEYYCLYFDDWSFHVPTRCFPNLDESLEGVQELPDFTSSPIVEQSQASLLDALSFLRKEYGVDANQYLEQRYVEIGGFMAEDIGWPELDSN